MTDYSQFGEQLHIEKALEETMDIGTLGQLMDIGAWHPTQFSNSRALIEMGWRAVLIEPSPACMLNLLAEYGYSERVTLVQAAVFPEAGMQKLHVSDDAVSTLSDAEHQKWKDHAKFRGGIIVPCITWEQIANRWGGFQFCNIDAEGVSTDLFLNMLSLGIFPPVVCVEHESRLEEMSAAATKENYALTFANGTNALWVRR